MLDTNLICTATIGEMDACLAGAGQKYASLPPVGGLDWLRAWSFAGRHYHLAVTGVGMVLTTARLSTLPSDCRPALLVNCGIAGAYPGSGLQVGDLILGESECFGDMGIELPLPGVFQGLGEMAWAEEIYKRPLPLSIETWDFIHPRSPLSPRSGRGCTVNACTGREETGSMRRELFGVDFESMEGASVALVAGMRGIPAAEVRAISNLASTRDMRPDNIALALRNLGVYMHQWLERT